MAKAKKTKARPKAKARPKVKAKAKPKAKPKAKAKPKPKLKPKPKPRTTTKAKAKTKGPRANAAPINQPICQDILQALMGQEVIFTGIVGTCQISLGDTEWPFTVPSPINFPSPGNPKIFIRQGLDITPPNNVYDYIVSCCPPEQATHTVTVTG